MRDCLPPFIALVAAVSMTASVAAQQDRDALSPAALLASSRTIHVVLSGPPELGEAVSRELRSWGRLREVPRLEEADLVLRVGREAESVTAFSEFGHDQTGGAAFAASVTDRGSGARLWSTSKGKTWQGSDGRGSWAGRAVVREFRKHFDKTTRKGAPIP